MTGATGRRRVQLTGHQVEVLDLVSRGCTNTVIGQQLFLTTNSVKTHLSRLFARIDAHDRAHAVRRGFELGLLTADEDRP